MNRQLLQAARGVRGAFALAVGFNFAAAIGMIVQAALLSRIVNAVFLGGSDLSAVVDLLLAAGGIIVLRAGLGWGSALAAGEVAIHVKTDLRRRLTEHVQALGPAYTRGERSGELVVSLIDGVDALDAFFREYLPALAAAVLIPLAVLVVVLPLDGLTFAVLLVTAPLIPLFMALIGMAAGRLARDQYADMSLLSAHFLDVMQGLPTLKLFNRSRHQIETIGRVTGQFREATMRVLRVAFLSALALEMLATLSVAIVAVQIGLRLLDGGIAFESALFLLVIAPDFYMPLRTLGAKFHSGTESAAAAERIFEILNTPVMPIAPVASTRLPDSVQIRFEDVSYTYPDGARPALDHITFEVEAGKRTALIGESGSGKSTIAALLLRFVAPEGGCITVDGINLNSLDIDAWRSQIGWVGQQPYLFNRTIAENIRLGRPDACDAEVIEAAKRAAAHEFITRLPQGYATPCGERGMRLSGGQAQRIAIARAFLKDAPLLILDEPTSNLDPENERLVLDALRRLMQGRTVLMIAHRLQAVADFDRLIVLSVGRVVEQGTHTDLLARDGAYRALVETHGEVA